MTSRTSSHDDFQSLTISEDSTVSEGTRRLLSPYNRNRFDALNRDIHNELNKVKENFRSLTNDLNQFQNGPELLKDLKDRIRHLNRILLSIKQRQEVLDDRNEQMLIDLQNYIWEVAKYSVRIEIYFCAIEHLKNQTNEYLQMAKRSSTNDHEQIDDFGKKLRDELQRLETRAKFDCQNLYVRETLEKLQQRCATIFNNSDRTQLRSLRNFQVKKSIINHCRTRLLD